MLRFAADRRTLLWMLVFAPGLVLLQYARPHLVPYLSWLSFYFAIAAGVVAHNHLHSPTFKNKRLNEAFGNWIAIFYGYPTFAWIPTHNLNHHKLVNRAGDATITWRYTNRHNYLVAASYFFVSSYFQSGPIKEYLARAKEKDPAQYRRILMQYVVVYGSHALMLGIGIYAYGLSTGLYLWGLTLGGPALVSLWTIMTFNSGQHVHTDPWSKLNHSRNFVGWPLNFLLFNNGLHTAHHEKAGLHWSQLPELHAKLAPEIHPDLLQKNLWVFWFKNYVLSPFFPRLGTVQIGRAPFDPPDGNAVDITTASIGVPAVRRPLDLNEPLSH